MKKRLIAWLLVLALVLCLAPTAFAADGVQNTLKGGGQKAGSNFNGIDRFTLNNPLDLSYGGPADEYSFWHFVDTSKESSHAVITYLTEAGETVEWTIYPSGGGQHFAVITPMDWVLLSGISYSTKSGNFNLSHSGRHEKEIGTVKATALVDKFYNELTPYENYSRTATDIEERDVTENYVRDVNKYYERDVDVYNVRDVERTFERTVDKFYHRDVTDYYVRPATEYYERTVDAYYERPVKEYWERTVDKNFERPMVENYSRDVEEFYERDVDEDWFRDVTENYERTVDIFYERPAYDNYERIVDKVYARDITENYYRDIEDIYAHDAQKYLIPVFTKKVISMEGTLVTRLTYSGTDKKAAPVNGNAFKNGHTYVAVDVAAASSEGGVWYEIADSSKNNGKKTPSEYNKPIGYFYNVKISGGKLTVSFDDLMIGASVGAYVVTDPKKFPGNAPAHKSGSVTVDLPKGYGDVVYLYTHIEKLDRYAGEDVYEFVGWRYDDARTVYGDYYLLRTDIGEYGKPEVIEGEYEFVQDAPGEYVFKNTTYGEYAQVGEPKKGEYEKVGETIYGDYVKKDENTVYGEYELVDTQYGEYELDNTEPIGEYAQVGETVYGEYVRNDAKTEIGEYALVKTKYGKYELVGTKYGEYVYDHSDEGEYVLYNTVYGDEYVLNDAKTVTGDYKVDRTDYKPYELVKTVEGEYVQDGETIYGDYEVVNTVYGEYEKDGEGVDSVKKAVEYTGGLTLTVNGEEKPLNESFELLAGTYEFVLTGNGEFEPITKIVTIHGGDNGIVDFGTISIQLPDVVNELVTNYTDVPTEPRRSDRETRKNYSDNVIPHYDDRTAKQHFADNYIDSYIDAPATEHYNDKDHVRSESNDMQPAVYSDKPATIHEKDVVTREYSDLPTTEHKKDVVVDKTETDRKAKETKNDRKATIHYYDNETVRNESDKEAEKHYSDRDAVRVESDIEGEDILTDREAQKFYFDNEKISTYIEAYNFLPDIKLGNDYDPFGEYAVIE